MSLENTQVEVHVGDGESVHTGHPTPATYFKVAMILSALTAVEVAIFYITPLSYGIIPILATLSIGKFVPGSPVLHAPEVRLEGCSRGCSSLECSSRQASFSRLWPSSTGSCSKQEVAVGVLTRLTTGRHRKEIRDGTRNRVAMDDVAGRTRVGGATGRHRGSVSARCGSSTRAKRLGRLRGPQTGGHIHAGSTGTVRCAGLSDQRNQRQLPLQRSHAPARPADAGRAATADPRFASLAYSPVPAPGLGIQGSADHNASDRSVSGLQHSLFAVARPGTLQLLSVEQRCPRCRAHDDDFDGHGHVVAPY